MKPRTLARVHAAATLPPTRSAPRYPRAASAAAIAAAPTPETRLARAGRRGKSARTASPDARTARRRIFSRVITPPPPEGRDAAARGPRSGTELPLPRSPHRRGQRTTPLARCVAAPRGPRPSTPPRHPPRSQSRGAPPPPHGMPPCTGGELQEQPTEPSPFEYQVVAEVAAAAAAVATPAHTFRFGRRGGNSRRTRGMLPDWTTAERITILHQRPEDWRPPPDAAAPRAAATPRAVVARPDPRERYMDNPADVDGGGSPCTSCRQRWGKWRRWWRRGWRGAPAADRAVSGSRPPELLGRQVRR